MIASSCRGSQGCVPAGRSSPPCASASRRSCAASNDRHALASPRYSAPSAQRRLGRARPAALCGFEQRSRKLELLDVGRVGALRRGEVDVVPAVVAFDHADVVLAGGMRIRPRVVVAATGFTRGLDDLVGHLGVLDSKGNPPTPAGRTATQAPGLYFVGYSNPLSGQLRQLGIDDEIVNVVREALSNVARHAHAHRVEVEVVVAEDQLRLTVTDDGGGARKPQERPPGYGLIGMCERATAVGGTLNANVRPQGGFVVSAHLPLPDAAHPARRTGGAPDGEGP